jgi:hypothetical protein
MTPKNVNRIARYLLGILFILGLAGMIVLALIRQMDRNLQYSFLCKTPSPVSIRGKVINLPNLMPVANAEITITDLTPKDDLCSQDTYLAKVQLTTDNEGVFHSGAPALMTHKFNITIVAADCDPYEDKDVSFALFSSNVEPTFFLGCQDS